MQHFSFTEVELGLWWDSDGHPHLQNDDRLASSAAVARFVAQRFGGFPVFLDPSRYTPDARNLFSRDGHHFAILHGRYLADPWAAWYAHILDSAILDFAKPEDRALVWPIYGTPSAWIRVDCGRPVHLPLCIHYAAEAERAEPILE